MGPGLATRAALALYALAFACLGAALVAPARWAPRSPPATVVALDRSAGAPVAEGLAAWTDLARRQGPPARTLVFAGRQRWTAGPPDAGPDPGLDGGAGDLEAAIRVAAAGAASLGATRVAVITDGLSGGADARAALAAARAGGLEVCWQAIGRTRAPVVIDALDAPREVPGGASVRVGISATGLGDRDLRVRATGSDGSRGERIVAAGDRPAVTLNPLPTTTGPLAIAVDLGDLATGASLAASAHAVVFVRAPARVLYVAETSGALAPSLVAGGWPVTQLSPRAAPTSDQGLAGYEVVVLDEPEVAAAPAPFWTALERAVRGHGTGLIVLGGPRAFAGADYAGSVLDRLLPVAAQPPADAPGEALGFVVDKSGSMGRGGSGVDRLALARTAVIDAARALLPADSVSLVAFDVDARLLLPQTPYGAARERLEAAWPIHAGGGTRLEPALRLAGRELGRAPQQRRTLVVLTDGNVNEPLTAVAEWLRQQSIRLVVLALGPDADPAALAPLGVDAEVVRVADVGALPRLLRGTIAAARTRIARGPRPVRERLALPFLAAGTSWPSLAAHLVMRARPRASVYLATDEDDVLLASAVDGAGRVVVLPGGLGDWASAWRRAPFWPTFAGGLVEWVRREGRDRGLAFTATATPAGLAVEADVAVDGRWSDAESALVTVRDAAGAVHAATAPCPVPGRCSVTLAGIATGAAVVTVASATTHASRALWVEPPAPRSGLGAPLVAARDAAELPDCGGPAPPGPPDLARLRRRLTAAALLAFLAALLVDRRHRLSRTRAGGGRSRLT